MVLKKSKHGFNTGNTLRSAALHSITPKSTAAVLVKHLESAQYEIEKKLDILTGERWNEYNNDYIQYLIRLYRTLSTLSYLPDLGVEFSLDKDKCWEILHQLDTTYLPNLWPYLPKAGAGEFFPFTITYKKTHKCATTVHYYNYCEHNSDSSNRSDLTSRQYLRHKNIRGVQRKTFFTRRKKDLSKQFSTQKGVILDEKENGSNNEDLSVYLDVFRDNAAIHKQCSTYKPQKESKFRNKRKDSIVTYLGKLYGQLSTSRGVHLISQDAFEKLKAMLGNGQVHGLCSQSQHTLQHSERTPNLNELSDNMKNKMVSFHLTGLDEGADSSGKLQLYGIWKEKNQSVIRKDNLATSHKLSKHAKKVSKEHYFKEYQSSKQEQRSRRKVFSPAHKQTQSHVIHKVNETNKCFFLTDSLLEVDIPDLGILPVNSKPDQFKSLNIGNIEGNREMDPKYLPSDRSMRKNLVKPDMSGKHKVDNNNKIKKMDNEDVLHQTLVQSNNKANDKSKQKTIISLWSAICFILDPIKYMENGKVHRIQCKSGQCSVHHGIEPVNVITPIEPPGVRPSKCRTPRGMKKQELASFRCFDNDSRTKVSMLNKKQMKQRRKDKRKPNLGTLLENASNSVNEALLPRGFLVKIKSSTLQDHHLQQKYGAMYQESQGYPRRLWINVSNMVSEIRKHRNEYDGTCTESSNLAFMNIHAILLIEETKVKFPYTEAKYNSGKQVLPHQTVIIQFKCDFDAEGKRELYRRLETKIRNDHLYPVAKLVEYFIEVYKVMTLEGFSYVTLPLREHREPHPLYIRHYDWLQALFDWEYQVHSDYNTYNMFKNSLQVNQLKPSCKEMMPLTNVKKHSEGDSRSPTFGALSQQIRPQNGVQDKAHGVQIIPNSSELISSTNHKKEAYSYVLCHKCYKMIITEGDFNSLKNHPNTLYKLDKIAGSRWTVRYTCTPACNHTVCDDCLHQHVVQEVNSARQSVISCPVTGCEVVLDPVVTLFAVSLTKYCRLLQKKLDDVVSSHPQWQWCPINKCHNAVKVTGSAMLDLSLVIECVCRNAWCFSCKREAHWPANCTDAAIYQQWKQSVDENYDFVLWKLLCNACLNDNTIHYKKQQNVPAMDSQERRTLLGVLDKVCQCRLLFCSRCLSVPHLSSTFPESIKEDKTAPSSSYFDALLPVLLFHQAINHHKNKKKWHPVISDIEITRLARIVVKSKTKRKAETILLPSHLKPLPVLPSCSTEKIFLSQVFQFVHQAYTFLEYVCVSLINMKSASMETKADIIKTTTELQKIINNIDESVQDIISSSVVSLIKVKHLFNQGRMTMTNLAIRMRSINPKR